MSHYKRSSPTFGRKESKQQTISHELHLVKFMFSKKTTKINKVITIELTLWSKCQIVSEDFVNFCELLKGQLISKCLFGVIASTKIPTKKFDNFCPRI